MKVTAKKHYQSSFALGNGVDHVDLPTRLFYLSIGGERVGSMQELKFELYFSTQDREFTFDLYQVLSADSLPFDPQISHRIESYSWSLNVRAIIQSEQEEVYLDSSEENEGLITDLCRTTQTGQRIHSVGLRNGSGSFESHGFTNFFTILTLVADLTVTASIIDHQQNIQMMNNSNAVGLGLLALRTKEHTDVTIKCESEEIKAHKVVLKCNSPVFARMFDSAMEESATNVIQIDDFEPETIQGMIDFMYEGDVISCSKDSIVALLDCAEKYDILELKVAVIQKMLSTITPDNAAEFAGAVTKFRGDEENKQKIFEYCKQNLSKLSTNEHFRQFFVENVKHFM